MLPTFQCLISMLMLLAQASNHLVSTIFYSAEPSTFYGCWLLKKLLLLILTKIRIVRVKKNTAISCQCCVVVLDVCCWWSEPPTSENRVSMLDTMPASDDRYDSHCAEYLLYISLQLYFLANTRAMHCTGTPPPTHFILKNCGRNWDRGMAAHEKVHEWWWSGWF